MNLKGLGKVLVTGGTGFVGSYLVKRLIEEGLDVRVMDNNLRGDLSRLDGLKDKFEFIEADICDYADTLAATRGMDTVFHLAFINGTKNFYENPDKVLGVGVKGAINTLDAAMELGVKNYAVTSSSEVYQEPTHIPTTEDERIIIPDIMNPRYSYSGGKIITELLALHYTKSSNMKVVILRPHNFYGANMGYGHVIPHFAMKMRAASNGGDVKEIDFPIQGTGEEERSFCHIDDAVDGMLIGTILGESNNIYHIGTEEILSIRDLAHLVADSMGLKINLIPTALMEGGTPKRCPSIAKIGKLGYKPKISLREGVASTVAWYASQGDTTALQQKDGILK
ncbi:MAG: NAD-dependent epimerase/dehydratase family protein [Candidatus Portiera sp.]|nr:NAD-dependent epimerase/dehydratase family protein [Portiera sp.]